jgi:hypothetical protein
MAPGRENERAGGAPRLRSAVVSDADLPPDEPHACPACGAVPEPEERFCRRCGTALPAPVAEEVPGREPDWEPDREADLVTDQGTGRLRPVVIAPSDGSGSDDDVTAIEQEQCRSCGTANRRDRELCGRCGADLETGVVPPHPLEPVPVPPRAGDAPPVPAHRWWIPILSVVVVVAAIVGALAYSGLGPFAAEAELPSVRFEPAAYAVEEIARLGLSDIATLTTRAPEEGRSFTPAQMVDQDPQTSWHSDGDELPEGAIETIDLFLERPAWLTQLAINNGDHGAGGAFEETSRIRRARVTFDGGEAVVVRLLDQGRQMQVVELNEPQLTTTVRIEILESFPGVDQRHVAVADLELWGWVADGGDQELAQQRAGLRPAAGAVILSKS